MVIRNTISAAGKITSFDSSMTKQLDEISIHPDLVKYIASLAGATREDPGIYMGVSPRGSLFLMKAAKASALLAGRMNVLPDDIKNMILPVFLHRIIFVNRKDRYSKTEYLNSVINRVEVPSESFHV